MRGLEIPPASQRKTSSMAQVAEGFGESEGDTLGEAGAEEAGSEDESEDVEDEAAEDDSADKSSSEDARKESIAEDPWPAHTSPAIGRTMKSGNSLLTQRRFTKPPEVGAAARVRTAPEVKNRPPASPSIGHGSNCRQWPSGQNGRWTPGGGHATARPVCDTLGAKSTTVRRRTAREVLWKVCSNRCICS